MPRPAAASLVLTDEDRFELYLFLAGRVGAAGGTGADRFGVRGVGGWQFGGPQS